MSISVKHNFNDKAIESTVRAAISMFGNTAAKKMEADAKINRPWTDRTSLARNSIRGNFEWQGKKARIVLSGGVRYFIWLELAHEKKWAILVPTIEKHAPEVVSAYKRIF